MNLGESLIEPLWKLSHNVSGVLRTVDRATCLQFLVGLAADAPRVLRQRNLAPVDRRMHGRSVTFRLGDTRVTLDGDDFSGAREMYCRRVYLANPKVGLRKGTTVIDLGSNVGLFTTLAARWGCRVISVEAQAGMVAEALRRLTQNACAANVELVCGLIGTGIGDFSTPEDVVRGSHHSAQDVVKPVSMDELLRTHDVQQVDFMKIDIEGSEFSLFRRYEPWMSRVRCIAMEVHPRFGTPEALEEVLHEAGFQTELRDEALRTRAMNAESGGYLYAWRE